MYVFVYGTLLSGERAADFIDRFESTSRESAQLSSRVFLAVPTHGSYPVVVEHREEETEDLPIHRVIGELVYVSDEEEDELLRMLDRYEGYPHLYNRREVLVHTDSGDMEQAWVYFMEYDSELMRDWIVVSSRSWKKQREDDPTVEEKLAQGKALTESEYTRTSVEPFYF